MPRLAAVLRLAIAVGATAWVVRQSNVSAVAAAFRDVSWTWLAGALLLVPLDRALMAYRWIALIDAPDRPPLRRMLRIFFESSFLGTFLPSVGGDAARAWSLSRDGVSGARSLASVLVDRLLGVASILGCALLGLALAGPGLNSSLLAWSIGAGGLVCAVSLTVVFSRRVDKSTQTLLAPWSAWRPVGALLRLLTALQRYRGRTSTLVAVLAASLAVQILRVAQAWMLGWGLGLTLAFSIYVLYVPVIMLVMMVPITISGFGTGNAAFVTLFSQVGTPAATAFALSMLFLGLGLLGTIPGGLLYAFGRRSPPPG